MPSGTMSRFLNCALAGGGVRQGVEGRIVGEKTGVVPAARGCAECTGTCHLRRNDSPRTPPVPLKKGVAGITRPASERTPRRWREGIAAPPARALSRLEALAHELDQAADAAVRAMDEVGSAPAALAVYRRDEDVPPWTRGIAVRKHLGSRSRSRSFCSPTR